MNVIKFNRIIVVSIILLSYSCDSKQNIEDENSFQIANLLVNYYSKSSVLQPSFPPPPDNLKYTYSTEDSLRIYKHFHEEIIRNKRISISEKMFSVKQKFDFENICNEDLQLLTAMYNLEEKSFDFSGIVLINSNLFLSQKNKINEIDIKINFSRISFNKTYDKAMLVLGVNFGELNSFSTLIYLEKEKYRWVIKCEKELSIS
jgi:hypothetical protein